MFKHKNVRHNDKRLHEHPSHPYPHPRGRWHRFPPTSRIKDRKGKHFRNTPAEHRHVKAKGSFRSRSGKTRKWD